MLTKKTILIIFLSMSLITCQNNADETRNDNNECYCDSIYYNKKGENKEILCYKGIDVYKLKYSDGKVSVLSRHNLNNPKYLYERLAYQNDALNANSSFYISSSLNDSLFEMTFVGPKVDSIEVRLANSSEKIMTKISKSNLVTINRKYLMDNVEVKVIGYETVDKPEIAMSGKVVKLHEIHYNSILKLQQNNLDTILKKFTQCIE